MYAPLPNGWATIPIHWNYRWSGVCFTHRCLRIHLLLYFDQISWKSKFNPFVTSRRRYLSQWTGLLWYNWHFHCIYRSDGHQNNTRMVFSPLRSWWWKSQEKDIRQVDTARWNAPWKMNREPTIHSRTLNFNSFQNKTNFNAKKTEIDFTWFY